jgi:predicted ATPase
MSYLAAAKKATPKPPIVTIVGAPGTGKTTLGALFPNPVFVQAEDGSAVFENWEEDAQPTLLPALPKENTFETLKAQLREIVTAEHDFKTLVLDANTSMSRMLEAEIAKRDGVASIGDASGGFHKGYTELAQWHAEIIYMCSVIRQKKNMAIVFLAHQGIEKVKQRPDDASQYSVYTLDMHKDSAAMYVSQSDAVIYIKHDEFVQGQETNKRGQVTRYGRLVQSGERKLITSGDGMMGYVSAKNRYGMDNEIPLPLGTNPITQFIKFFNTGA